MSQNGEQPYPAGECPICYNSFTDDVPAQVTPCGHLYCADCLNVGRMNKCALCRTSFVHPICNHVCLYRPLTSHPKLPAKPVVLEDNCINCSGLFDGINLLSRDEQAILLNEYPEYRKEKNVIVNELLDLYAGGPIYNAHALMQREVSPKFYALHFRMSQCDQKYLRRLADKEKEALKKERW